MHDFYWNTPLSLIDKLFNTLYINDLPNVFFFYIYISKCRSFAEDTSIYSSHDNSDSLQEIVVTTVISEKWLKSLINFTKIKM